MKLTKDDRHIQTAYAEAMLAAELQQPKRIYLGNGIWWAPSENYLRHARRLAIREEAE